MDKMDRRSFLYKAGRGSLLAALAAVVGTLFVRQQVVRDQECSSEFQCRNCRKLSGCNLPEAAKAREHGKEG